MSEIMLFDTNVEKSALGCMLLDREAESLCCGQLSGEDFSNALYRHIFEIMRDMNKRGEIIDAVTLNQRIRESEGADLNTVSTLTDIITSVSTSVNVRQYIKLLQEKTYRRKAVRLSEDIKKAALESKDIDNIWQEIDKAQNLAVKNTDMESMTEALERAILKINDNWTKGRKFTGLKTGFGDFDIMTGGLQNCDLIVLAARPSMGKTAFALDILRNAAEQLGEQNKIGLVFSLEMSKEQLSLRMFSAETEIPSEKFRFCTLNDSDLGKMEKAAPIAKRKLNTLFVSENMGTGINDIFAQCCAVKSAAGKDIGIIAIDYLQLIETKGENRAAEISAISRSLKKMAKQFNCPVLVLSQLSRACEQRADHRPMLSDLRESGAIEQDADIVVFLYRDEYYFPQSEKKNIAELNIAKQRNGAVGTIELYFAKENISFKSLERRWGH